MFRKLITNLSFSPTLIGEVAQYAKKLKKEEKIRRWGVFLLIPAMALQIIAIVRPPESANTASNYDLVYGGISSVGDLLYHYDKNELNIKDIFTSLGITRSELLNLTEGKITSRASEQFFIISTQPKVDADDGGVSTTFQKAAGGTGSLHFTPLDHNQVNFTAYNTLSGTSQTAGDFSILKGSGAIALRNIPTAVKPTEISQVALSHKVYNNTQNSSSFIANTSDRITYTLAAKNTNEEQATAHTFTANLSDVHDYADVLNTHGGELDTRAQTISWPSVNLGPGESQEKQFTIRIKTPIPATAHGEGNPHSYDCHIKNSYGNSTVITVACPISKIIESTSAELPAAKESMVITINITLTALILFFYLRSLHQKEEIRLIRRDANEGLLL